MSIVDRAKNICLSPATEWTVIAGETTPTASLVTGYVLPLAAIGAVAGFVGGSVLGRTLPFVGTYRVPVTTGLGIAIFTLLMAVVGVVILGVIIDLLAPTFGGQKDSAQAMKVAVYSYTPAWLAGVLQLFTFLGILAIFAALYGMYILYLGLPRLMKAPEDKALGYTAVVIVCAVVISVVVAMVGGLTVGAGMMGAGAMSGAMSGMTGGMTDGGRGSEVEFAPDSPLGKLQELGRRAEEGAAKMEEAQKSGDTGAQMGAAMETLGAILGGGSRVDPMSVDDLKAFVPETLAGLPRTRSNAERSGFGGLMVAKAEAAYGDDGQRTIELEITDSGGVSGLMGLAAWMGAEGEKEDDTAVERTRRVEGRMTHEKMSKAGGANEYSLVVADRFIVNTVGRGVDLDGLKAAVASLDLGGLEARKASDQPEPD